MKKPKNNLPRRISGTALSVMLTMSLILNGGYGRVSGADTAENTSDNTPSVSEKRQTDV